MSTVQLRAWSVAAAMIMAACGGQPQQSSVAADYAKEVERLVGVMNAAIDAHDREAESGLPSIEKERARFDGSLQARNDFLEGAQALEPPPGFENLHGRATLVIEDLRDANAALADAAHAADTLDEWKEGAWLGPAGEVYRQADERALELCLQVQDFFDNGVDQAVEFASPWLRTSTVETPVDINLGCSAGE